MAVRNDGLYLLPADSLPHQQQPPRPVFCEKSNGYPTRERRESLVVVSHIACVHTLLPRITPPDEEMEGELNGRCGWWSRACAVYFPLSDEEMDGKRVALYLGCAL